MLVTVPNLLNSLNLLFKFNCSITHDLPKLPYKVVRSADQAQKQQTLWGYS